MTREERLDWLCRLRSGLVWFDVPPKERLMFQDALSEEIKALSVEPCEDAISRQAVLEPYKPLYDTDTICIWVLRKNIEQIPPVTPKQKMGRCKDCKWWKDSDGLYRRGGHAESQCPINRREVFEGNGYCYMFEPKESEGTE